MPYLEISIAMIFAYLIGSISSAVVVCRLMGLPDPRTQGSKNPGATNVLRIGGKKAAILTLVGDIVKGIIPVLLAKLYGFDTVSLSLITFATILGHLYPVFFRFEGGKGVATALGCILALAWPVAIALLATWLLIAYLFRYSSLASLVTSLLSPLYMWYFTNWEYTYLALAITFLLIYRHRVNIGNLMTGKEGKIKLNKKA